MNSNNYMQNQSSTDKKEQDYKDKSHIKEDKKDQQKIGQDDKNNKRM